MELTKKYKKRGFFCVITPDRIVDLYKFLTFLFKFNDYPVLVVCAANELDAYRKKTMVGFLSPFEATAYLDTDILVNGSLDFLFEIAEKGYLGVYHEKTANCYNAGVLALPRGILETLSSLWLPLFEARAGYVDQGPLNKILPKFPVFELPQEYNCILKEITPEEELLRWNDIKIFHFLHEPTINRNLYKSYRLYHS